MKRVVKKKTLGTFGHWHLLKTTDEDEDHWFKEGLVTRPKEAVYDNVKVNSLQTLVSSKYTKGDLFFRYSQPLVGSTITQTEATNLPKKVGLSWQKVDCGEVSDDESPWFIW